WVALFWNPSVHALDIGSAESVRPIAQYAHSAWRGGEGLPQNTVKSIVQTNDGYLWLATFDGLVRFDGMRFAVLGPSNTKELPSSRFTRLKVDRSGALWIFYEGNYGPTILRNGVFRTYSSEEGRPNYGAASDYTEDSEGAVWFRINSIPIRFKDDRFTAYTQKDGLPSGTVYDVCADAAGNVWMSTDLGLIRFKQGHFTTYGSRDGLSFNGKIPPQMYGDTKGNFWICTGQGLVRFKDGRFVTFTRRDGLPSDNILRVYEDSTSSFWVLTDKALVKFDEGRFTTYSQSADLAGPGESVHSSDSFTEAFGTPEGNDSFREDKEGYLWIRTTRGLIRFRDGAFRVFGAKEGICDRELNAHFVDREGNLWIGTAGCGLELLKPAALTVYSKLDGLPDDEILCVLAAKDGSRWIGTHSGLTHFASGKFTTYTTRDGLPSNAVWSIAEDHEGALWIGMLGRDGGGGLAKMKDGKIAPFIPKDGGVPKWVTAIYEDRTNALYFGTWEEGLWRLKDERWTVYCAKDGFPGNSTVRSIYEDRDGTLWIGSDGGVVQLKADRITAVYTKKDGLSDNFIRPIYQDRDGVLWFGTYGNGLNRFKDGKFTTISTLNGLFDHTVSKILEDDKGFFWMTCNRGIYRVSRKELNDFAEGKTPAITCDSYGLDEGMANIECNGGSSPAGCKTDDGRLWFPTMGGIVMIDPRHTQVN
ncbi:MAG: ligand-binding sensor domain-containing protein, partial [Blastocatellia bacterium]